MLRLLKFGFLFMAAALGYAKPSAPFLVLDGKPNDLLPKRFRVIDSRGLKAIASGQFSERQLVYIKNQLNEPVVIIDLRQESHGFVNGYPVSWYAAKNQANLHKPQETIQAEEQRLLSSLADKKSLLIEEIKAKSKSGEIQTRPLFTLKPERIESEQALAARLGFGYKRFYVTDHRPPTKSQVHELQEFISTVPEDTWIYFHCRGGSGRTTAFVLLYDIFKNGQSLPLSALFKLHHEKGGKDLRLLPEKKSYQYQDAVKRLRLIEEIYVNSHQA
ncbi:hypothetical protein [Legionella londiniensis]|uniref:Tyrosine phosphatase II superfamily protein n=1 Tax=Legionella londiniensis TaxID=45068 RepID=A0A0W0VKN7_9GAMM|nr:hypothetical protein [Legionella londiniensis]KTD20664.1 tyrosine phosphatase II superfamily protein [Legionella londiniensis]STX92865.1 tyrosine phosphatase II superfamily protein [Legionella londiniensis]